MRLNKRLMYLAGLGVSLGLIACATHPAEPVSPSSRTLLIFYDTQVGPEPLKAAFAKEKATILYEYHTLHGFAVRVPEKDNLARTKKRLEKVPGVLSVQPDRTVQVLGGDFAP